MLDLESLNQNQKDAVLSTDKYLRIVAGAGSGKTRVLTMRIAHLVEDIGVKAYHILAITFTNKAANEMKHRLLGMLEHNEHTPWISTIHSLCVRILREDILALGWPRNFTVLDAEDQKSLIKEACKQLNLDPNLYPVPVLLDYIANQKCAFISVEHAKTIAGAFAGEKNKARVYEYYVNRQNQLYALDFDDLILNTVKLFQTYPDILEKWQDRYHYIHVDEFQDIDKIQYRLIKLLAGNENDVYVVGDPDQTIYTWRGADVNIILNFEKDFKGSKTIYLNQNYRSSKAILESANALISNNKFRLKKDLFTQKQDCQKITLHHAASDENQANWISRQIQVLHQNGKAYKDMAILYRSNYLSRALEKGLMEEHIPYIIYGGIRFFERMEVKDALAYLKMAILQDDLSFQRIINKPKRGLGEKTLDQIASFANQHGITLYETIKRHSDQFTNKTKHTLDAFVEKVEKWRSELETYEGRYPEFFEMVLEQSNLKDLYQDPSEKDRLENMKELIDDVHTFFHNFPQASYEEYLQQVSLYGDRDETLESDFVQLMTVHAAKGLEFDTVFLSDFNEGIFPNERALNENKHGLEEERRLAYVAITRAKEKLYLCEAGGFSYLLQRMRSASRFIGELPEQYIDFYQKEKAANNFTSRIFTEKDETFTKPARTSLKKGDLVQHKVFGDGVIINIEGNLASIAFPLPTGIKKIMATHPSLTKKG